MSNEKSDASKSKFDDLEKSMHDADQFHTLEEKVADMKRRGIDPSQVYKELDRKKGRRRLGRRHVEREWQVGAKNACRFRRQST